MTDRPAPKLDQVNVVVRDMEATSAFYRLLGFELPDAPSGWDMHHRNVPMSGDLDLDLDSTAFASQWDRGWPADRPGVVIGFRVANRADVDALYQELTETGHEGQQEPYDAFWGARYAIVSDPDGNAVGLMSPADPGRRRAPDLPN